jgi:hypothetical protein
MSNRYIIGFQKSSLFNFLAGFIITTLADVFLFFIILLFVIIIIIVVELIFIVFAVFKLILLVLVIIDLVASLINIVQNLQIGQQVVDLLAIVFFLRQLGVRQVQLEQFAELLQRVQILHRVDLIATQKQELQIFQLFYLLQMQPSYLIVDELQSD